VKVTDPAGDTWRVRRRWLPWRRRVKDVDLAPVDGVPDLDGVALVILAALLLPLVVFFALVVAEIFLLLMLVPVVALVRAVVLRRWPIAVRREKSHVWDESVRGWRGSRDRMRAIADAVARGEVALVKPPDVDLPRHRS